MAASLRLSSSQLTEAPGLRTLLNSDDFSEWDAMVATTLGHHRSSLQRGSVPFSARIRCGELDEFQILLLQGSGRLELVREQCQDGVLWIPLEGMIRETINGSQYLAEPGTVVLFRPGDVMVGHTADSVCGVSIVIPERYLDGPAPAFPLFRQGTGAQQLIQAGKALARAAALEPDGSRFAAEALVDALYQCCHPVSGEANQERITATRRRALVLDACAWMESRSGERFSVTELSTAMDVSVRTVQNSFQTELGCSPMAELKRLRLHKLRQLLVNPELQERSIAELMEEAGLLACGVTSADYERLFGELPKRSRQLP